MKTLLASLFTPIGDSEQGGTRTGASLPSTGQKTGTPSRTSFQFGTKKSAGSMVPLACAQSISSWRISCCAL